MTFLKYLKDRSLIIIGWLILSLLMVFMVWLTPGLNHFWDNISYLLVLQLFLIFVFFALDYYRRGKWYKALDHQADSHWLFVASLRCLHPGFCCDGDTSD